MLKLIAEQRKEKVKIVEKGEQCGRVSEKGREAWAFAMTVASTDVRV